MLEHYFSHNALAVNLHLQELRKASAEERRARQVRRPRRLRQQIGGALVAAGEHLRS